MRITSITPMKNEGPFILEWVAYHRLIGVNDIMVFSNDCEDGSDLLLDRLDDLGYIRHYQNPTAFLDTAQHHLTAIRYANTFTRLSRSDYILSLDADEFLCVNAGKGHVFDLLDAVGDETEVISLNQLNFGCNGMRHYEDGGLQMDRFTSCHRLDGDWNGKGRRGVKSLVKQGANYRRLSNHSPKPRPRGRVMNWVNASGQGLPDEMRRQVVKFLPLDLVSYEHAQINHYPVRDLDTFMVKAARGDANHPTCGKDVRYFDRYNACEVENTAILRHREAMLEIMEAFMHDPDIRDLHRATVRYHKDRIDALRAHPDFARLRAETEASHAARYEAQPVSMTA